MCVRTKCCDPANPHFSFNCLPKYEEIETSRKTFISKIIGVLIFKKCFKRKPLKEKKMPLYRANEICHYYDYDKTKKTNNNIKN